MTLTDQERLDVLREMASKEHITAEGVYADALKSCPLVQLTELFISLTKQEQERFLWHAARLMDDPAAYYAVLDYTIAAHANMMRAEALDGLRKVSLARDKLISQGIAYQEQVEALLQKGEATEAKLRAQGHRLERMKEDLTRARDAAAAYADQVEDALHEMERQQASIEHWKAVATNLWAIQNREE